METAETRRCASDTYVLEFRICQNFDTWAEGLKADLYMHRRKAGGREGGIEAVKGL